MAKKNIKNIIFDYGNVIINLDIEATYRAFEKIGAVKFDDSWRKIMDEQVFKKYERGDISSPNFRNILRSSFTKPVSDTEIDWAWNQLLKDMPSSRIELLKKLKTKFRTFILSNSNEIHFNYYSNELNTKHHLDQFDSLFEKAYFSYQVNLIKPEQEFYQLVLNNHQLNPSETLFIDDLRLNIDAASHLGINTVWLKPEIDICDLFNTDLQINDFCFSIMQ